MRYYSSRNGISRWARGFGLIFLIWTFYEAFTIRRAISYEASKDPLPFRTERIFIASIHWTDELILREQWMESLYQVAQAIGQDNVFVSIEESGSLDDTKGALQLLDEKLGEVGVRRSIRLDNTSRADLVSQPPAESGWVLMPYDKTVRATLETWRTIPKGQPMPRRIPYLASLRNLALEPMFELAKSGERFDKILFLNDVAFQPSDVLTLLNTRNGDYASVCALDFKKPPAVYDTFALRDAAGHEPLTQAWPYFRSGASRQALKSAQPVPMSSCWNGMLIMEAAPFYNAVNPLRFRAISDSLGAHHLEGSESCLIHTDNPLSQSKGVWLNPNVRVGYTVPAYTAVNSAGRTSWLTTWAIVRGLWSNRISRWTSSTRSHYRKVASRVALWQKEHPDQTETGLACLVDETQVLIFNGWTHV